VNGNELKNTYGDRFLVMKGNPVFQDRSRRVPLPNKNSLLNLTVQKAAPVFSTLKPASANGKHISGR